LDGTAGDADPPFASSRVQHDDKKLDKSETTRGCMAENRRNVIRITVQKPRTR
jgi:hypothetical protein